MEQRKGGSRKGFRFGAKQKSGNSRSAYFASRKLYRAQVNKARRIKKAEREKEKWAAKRTVQYAAPKLLESTSA
jgi:hypothetical protein